MAWWNPLDWAADAVASKAKKEIDALYGHLRENPEILAFPAALAGGAILIGGTLWEAKSVLGPALGFAIAEEVQKW